MPVIHNFRFRMSNLIFVALMLCCAFAFAFASGEPQLRIDGLQHTGPIRRIAIDPTENWIVTSGDDKSARVWSLKTKKLISVLRIQIDSGDTGRLYGAAISPDGNLIALGGTTGRGSAGHKIYLFDSNTRVPIRVIDARAGEIKHLIWTPDGKFIIASYAGDSGVRVFDLNGELVYAEKYSGASYGADISSKGILAVPAFDGSVRLYRLTALGVEPDGQIELPMSDPVSVGFSPDGVHLAVGYNRSHPEHESAQLDIFNLSRRELVKRVKFNDVHHGNLMNVVWDRSGRSIYAAGSGYHGSDRFIAKQIAWPGLEVTEIEIGKNSITDLLALSDGQIAFSSFDQSWGTLRGAGVSFKQAPSAQRLSRATSLKINPDGTKIGWLPRDGSRPVVFDLRRRAVLEQGYAELAEPSTSSFRYSTSRWENHHSPQLNGSAVALLPGELSRAVALLPDHSAALLGSSWSLRKIDRSGAQVWRIPFPTEVSAVNVTQDSRTAVVATVDGTMRWLRISDGQVLLSLFTQPDGRWVLWTEQGHYDASAGGETLVGWHVNRADGMTADFFPVSRFRARFYRPDVIDQSLRFIGMERALALANQELQVQAEQWQGQEIDATTQNLLVTEPPTSQLPPVLNLVGSKAAQSADRVMQIDFTAFSHAAVPISSWQVKVDGRPVDPIAVTSPAQLNGKDVGRLMLLQPDKTAVVQVFAVNEFGVSEPIAVQAVQAEKPLVSAQNDDSRPILNLLAIGVAKYANSDYNLLFPAKDASDFVRVLKLQEGKHYKKVNSMVLTDAEATRKSISSGLAWLRDATKSEDIAMLFIAGHGVTDAVNSYRFLPHDGNLASPQNTMITEEQIRDALVNIRGKVILFADTCYSGAATGRFSRNDLTIIANKLASPENGVIVFSSSDGRQESLEKKSWNNGAFTKQLVAGLTGEADFRKEGVVTHKGLDYFVSHEVRKMTGGKQTPVTTVPMGTADFALTSILAQ